MAYNQRAIKPSFSTLAYIYLPCSPKTPNHYHELRPCGHIVSTENIEPCGSNCAEKGTAPAFICQVCIANERNPAKAALQQEAQGLRNSQPAAEDIWREALYMEHPEAFQEKGKCWQLREIQQTLKGRAAEKERGGGEGRGEDRVDPDDREF